MKNLVLASRSPRRRALLETFSLPFEIEPAHVHESWSSDDPPQAIVETLAYDKANAVHANRRDAIVLGADTVVAYGDTILGKPSNEEEARATLHMLSGAEHAVYTGVALVSSERTVTFHEKTRVFFRELSDAEIDAYIRTGEPFDKAGSYGIQVIGSLFVSRIQGDYTNVVGLPVPKTMHELKAFGIDVFNYLNA